LVAAAKALMSHGITEAEVSRMMKDNPARLLGLTSSSTP
jgi:predicted metal-dependent phosphotriesterase family hydrolase